MTKHLTTFNDATLTVDDVVERLKVTGKNPRRTVISYALKGLLRGRRINRDWRFHPQAITDFLLGKP